MRVKKFNVIGNQVLFSYEGSGTFEKDLPALTLS